MYINASGDSKFTCEFDKTIFGSMFYHTVGIISSYNLSSANSVTSVCYQEAAVTELSW